MKRKKERIFFPADRKLYLFLMDKLVSERPSNVDKKKAMEEIHRVYLDSRFFKARMKKKEIHERHPALTTFMRDAKKALLIISLKNELIAEKPKNVHRETVENEFDLLYERSELRSLAEIRMGSPSVKELKQKVKNTLEFISKSKSGEFNHCASMHVDSGSQVNRAPDYTEIPFYDPYYDENGFPAASGESFLPDEDDDDDTVYLDREYRFLIFDELQGAQEAHA